MRFPPIGMSEEQLGRAMANAVRGERFRVQSRSPWLVRAGGLPRGHEEEFPIKHYIAPGQGMIAAVKWVAEAGGEIALSKSSAGYDDRIDASARCAVRRGLLETRGRAVNYKGTVAPLVLGVTDAGWAAIGREPPDTP